MRIKNYGFSLIELLVVLGILFVLVMISIPSVMKSRMALNEREAIHNLRIIGSAEVAFAAVNGGDYTRIQNLISHDLLPDRFKEGFNGYNYVNGDIITIGKVMNLTPPNGFGILASPKNKNSGRYIFGIGPDQVIRYQGTDLTVNEPPMCVDKITCVIGDPVDNIKQ